MLRLLPVGVLLVAACGRSGYDVLDTSTPDAPGSDAPLPADAAPPDAPPAIDAAPDAPPAIDAAPDAPPAIDAAPDAPPAIDAAPPDAWTCAAPYTQSSYGCHRFFPGLSATWHAAAAACEADGAHLVVYSVSGEGTYVFLTNLENHWVGASDTVVEGTFRWVTDEALPPPAFASGQPDDGGGVEDCVEQQILGPVDRSCLDSKSYVCERDGRAASPAASCDTSLDATCGDCSTACTGGLVCVAQVCE